MKLSVIKRLLLGRPLQSHLISEEKISNTKALAVLSSDALSSVAYATEEILLPLVAFSVAAASWSMPLAILIISLLILVTISYRQTIQHYPNGGGAYVVAKENIGLLPGLVAGSALLIDYVLTVAVSSSAGVSALTSAFPELLPWKVTIAVFFIVLLTILNLRGIRESATLFSVPTYLFIGAISFLIIQGIWRILEAEALPSPSTMSWEFQSVPMFLLIRAFSSGCTALTGIEAISNAVPAFKKPEYKNAQKTMLAMSLILAFFFLGVTALSHFFGVLPNEHQTVISQLTRAVVGEGWFYYFVQIITAAILFLAANTAYNGFPWLCAVLARDGYLPRQFALMGDRLVFSNAIFGLSAAAIILVILFGAETHSLIPLYAVGVFVGFTLSQFGMVRKHWRERAKGYAFGAIINGLGSLLTAIVVVVLTIAKFQDGAWVVALLIPFIVFVCSRIRRHYNDVGSELTLEGHEPNGVLTPIRHVVILPISGVHQGVLPALKYAITIAKDVRPCFVEIRPEDTARMRNIWVKWAPNLPLIVLPSPYRSVVTPLLDYIDEISKSSEFDLVTVIIPEFVTAKWWHSLLHNQTAFIIRAALMFRRRKVVTSIRYHLNST